MAVGTTDYKGLTVLDAVPRGAGGQLIQDNFKELADRWGAQSLYGGDDEPVPGYTVDHQAACDDETEGRWTVYAGDTLAWKTDKFFRSTAAVSQAVSVSRAGDTSRLNYTPAAAVDCAGKYLIIRIYQYHADLPDAFGTYFLYAYSEGDFSKASDPYTFCPKTTNLCDTGPGWRTYIVPVDSIGLGTLDDFTAITRISIRCGGGGTDATEFAVHQLDVVTPTAIPGSYVIRIDSIADAYIPIISTYAAAKGVKLTIGVNAAQLSTSDPTYAAAAMLQDYGHEIVVYGSKAGGANWQNFTAAEKLAYVSVWRRQMAAARVAWNGVLFVPGGLGIGGPWDRANLIRPGLLSCISGAYYSAAGNYPTLPGFRVNSWSGFINDSDGTVPGWLAGVIADCENNGGLLVLGAHVAIENDRDSLKLAIDALEASTLVNKTFGENIGL